MRLKTQPLRLSSGKCSDRWIHHLLPSSMSMGPCVASVRLDGGGIFGIGTFKVMLLLLAAGIKRACFFELGAVTTACCRFLRLGSVMNVGTHGTISDPLGFACDFGIAPGTTCFPFPSFSTLFPATVRKVGQQGVILMAPVSQMFVQNRCYLSLPHTYIHTLAFGNYRIRVRARFPVCPFHAPARSE